MRNETCLHESEVLKACRSGEWRPDLLRHYEACAGCQEAERTAYWIRAAAIEEGAFPLPDPDILWIQARIVARERDASRILWISTFRKTLVFGSLSAAAMAVVLHTATSAGIPVEQWPQILPGNFGVIPLGLAVLMAAVVYLGPSLLERVRVFWPF